MHLDWLFEFVIAVARFSIARAIKDSAWAASEMIICLHDTNKQKKFNINIYHESIFKK